MSYSAVPIRSTTDTNSFADINQLQENISFIAGGIYAITSNYTILANDGYGIINVNPTSGDITVTLPAAADSTNRNIYVNVTHSGGKVTVDGAGAETINGKSSVYLQSQYDFLWVYCDGTEWFVKDFDINYETGWRNFSDQTNMHYGTCEVDYDNLGGGGFTVGEVITEATSSYTGIIQADSGSTLKLKIPTGGGVFTNNRVITGSTSGETADVNEPSGTNKNQDSNVFHNFGIDLKNLQVDVYWSSDGTESNAYLIYNNMGSGGGAADYGFAVYQVDTDNIKVQTGQNGFVYLTDAGAWSVLATADDYFNVKVKVRRIA